MERRTPPPPPAPSVRSLRAEEVEPLADDELSAAPAQAVDKKTEDAIGRLFEKTPHPSALTPIAAKAVAAADKAKAEADANAATTNKQAGEARAKPALPDLVEPELFSASAPAARAPRSKRIWIFAALGVAVLGVAAVLILGHSSKSGRPAVAKTTVPSPTEPEHPREDPPAKPSEPDPAPADQTIEFSDDPMSPAAGSGAKPVKPAQPGTSGTAPAGARPTGATPTGAGATPAGSGAKPVTPTKPATGSATVEAPVSADGCDKVSCVIDAYARPCCAQFRPRKPDAPPTELDRDMILAGMSKAKPAVIRCGEASPSAKGIVRLSMKVTPNGTVEDAAVAETPDPALGACVAAAVRKVTFAQTEAGGSFAYPFKF